MPEPLPADIRAQIEPQVRHVLVQLRAVQRAASHDAPTDELRALLHQVEYALGQMLPTIQGRLNVSLTPALAGMTFHGVAR